MKRSFASLSFGLALGFLTLSLGVAPGLSPSAQAAAPTTAAEVFLQTPRFNGTVLIAYQGKVLYQSAQGFSDPSRKEKLNLASAFNLASLSKPFTALAVAQLVEDRKLRFDDKVQKYLDLPYPEITIDQLLGHRSGLPDYIALAEAHWEGELLTNADVLKLFRTHKPALEFSPNSKYEYSNTGYALLASVVEAVSKQSFADYVKTNILDPVGMKDSYVYQPGKSKPVVKGMAWKGPQLTSDYLTWMDGVVGDGGIYSSVLDLHKWQEALFKGRLVSAPTLKRMFTAGRLNNGKATEYGYGWVVEPDSEMVWHNGSWAGFRSQFSYDPTEDLLAIALNNTGYEDNDALLDALMALQPALQE